MRHRPLCSRWHGASLTLAGSFVRDVMSQLEQRLDAGERPSERALPELDLAVQVRIFNSLRAVDSLCEVAGCQASSGGSVWSRCSAMRTPQRTTPRTVLCGWVPSARRSSARPARSSHEAGVVWTQLAANIAPLERGRRVSVAGDIRRCPEQPRLCPSLQMVVSAAWCDNVRAAGLFCERRGLQHRHRRGRPRT